jgi:hypothetical protein
VRLQSLLSSSCIRLSNWDGNPLKAAAPGSKAPVELTLLVHASNWDPDSYVSSHVATPATPPRQGLAPSHAAAAGRGVGTRGSVRRQPRSQAEPATTYSPYTASAHLDNSKRANVTGLSFKDIRADHGDQALHIVLQEQV